MKTLIKNNRLWICAIALGVLLPIGVRAYHHFSREQAIEQAINTAAPHHLPAHTITLLETSHGDNRTMNATYIYARKSDGSTARITQNHYSFSPTGTLEMRFIRQANGTWIDSRSDVKMKTTYIRDANSRKRKAALLGELAPATQCTKDFAGHTALLSPATYEGMEQVNGYDAMKIVSHPGPTVTEWRAPALGCDIIKLHTDWGKGEYSDQVATQIELGEPDPALFETDPDMKEASPLEMETAAAEEHHSSVSPNLLPKIMAREKVYQQLKSEKMAPQ